MNVADQRFAGALATFLQQEIGKAVISKCVFTFRDHWSGKWGREAFYAAITQTSVVCGYFEYAYGNIWLFRDRLRARNHRFRTIEMATDRNLFEILGLNAAIVFEREKREVEEIVKDSAERCLYLQVGEHEKMYNEEAIYQSKIVNKFTTHLEERVTRILEDANSANGLIGNSEA